MTTHAPTVEAVRACVAWLAQIKSSKRAISAMTWFFSFAMTCTVPTIDQLAIS